jgi:hypothetical protein
MISATNLQLFLACDFILIFFEHRYFTFRTFKDRMYGLELLNVFSCLIAQLLHKVRLRQISHFAEPLTLTCDTNSTANDEHGLVNVT